MPAVDQSPKRAPTTPQTSWAAQPPTISDELSGHVWGIGQRPTYEFIGFGAMDVTKPYEFIGFGAMDVTKPYEFIGFGAMDVPFRLVSGILFFRPAPRT